MYIVNVESGPADARAAGGRQRRWRRRARARRRRRRRRPAAAAAWCSRAMAARCTSDPAPGLFAATISRRPRGAAEPRRQPAAAADVAADAAAAAAPATRPTPAAPTRPRAQVTYTANLEVDHKALRAQVFNEGWRIMKNRFYDAKMHGADWTGREGDVRAAARLPRRRGGAAHRHDDDDRPAQRVAHRRERRRPIRCARDARRAIRASMSSPIRPATTGSATSTRTARPITTT